MRATFTCPRCFFTAESRPGPKFCPRCGLPDPAAAAADTAPMEITAGGRVYRVEDRIAIGSICNIYRCRFRDQSSEVEGVLKIARDPCSNERLVNESQALRRLHHSDGYEKFGAFLPRVEQSFAVGGAESDVPRQANVLKTHREIRSFDELYTLEEVHRQYPSGLDGRDVAWIWRRLLSVLGYAHSHGVVHGAVLPMHVLIEPKEHKLLLIDWCCASHSGSVPPRPVSIIDGGYIEWYKRGGALRHAPTPALDVAFAARCMIELLNGDPLDVRFPESVEQGLQRHFVRCIDGGQDAWKLLDDFDRLIEALWGPRRFRKLEMPPKRMT